MMDSCLICNNVLPELKTGGAGSSKKSRVSDSKSAESHLYGDSKSKFVLTSSQYTIIQKVLMLPIGICRSELINGPYCRDCFTNINNVCHIMSALENLQDSVEQFRKDFNSKMELSFEASKPGSSQRAKRKLEGSKEGNSYALTRRTILDCLRYNFQTPSAIQNVRAKTPIPAGKPRHLHEIYSSIDPDIKPDTEVAKEEIVCLTNGHLPLNKRYTSGRIAAKRSVQEERKGATVSTIKTEKKSAGGPAKNTDKVAGAVNSGSKLSCTPCGIKFFKKESYHHHMSTVHEETEYSCWQCNYKCKSDEELEKHEQCHKTKGGKRRRVRPRLTKKKKSTKSNICPVPTCNKRLQNLPALKSHMRSHPGIQPDVLFQCISCSLKFPTQCQLHRHNKSVHGTLKGIIKKNFRPGRCKICSRIVTNLPMHMSLEHPGEKLNTATSIKPVVPPSNISKNNGLNEKKKEVVINAQATSSSTEPSRPGPASSKLNKLTTSTEVPSSSSLAETKPKDVPFENRRDVMKHEIKTDRLCETETKTNVPKTVDNSSATSADQEVEKLCGPLLPKADLFKNINATVNANPSVAPSVFGSKFQFKNLLKIGDKK